MDGGTQSERPAAATGGPSVNLQLGETNSTPTKCDFKLLKSAVDAIPAEKLRIKEDESQEDKDFETYWDVVFGIYEATGASSAGFELALGFSKRVPDHSDWLFNECWAYGPGKQHIPYCADDVFRHAAVCGWAGLAKVRSVVLTAISTFNRRQQATSHVPTARNYLPKCMTRQGLADGLNDRVLAQTLTELIDAGDVVPNATLSWKSASRHAVQGLDWAKGVTNG